MLNLNKQYKKLPSQFALNNWVLYSIFFSALLIVLVARIHLLSFPLERDEGEYAYMGKLILEGHPPYTLAYNMKLPGTYYMYALIMAIFGKNIIGIHLGFTVMSLISMVLVYFISKRFVSSLGALSASISFGIFGTSITVLGQAAHATHFVTFFSLLGTFLIFKNYFASQRRSWLYFLSGICFSFAFLCKQSGLFFIFWGLSIICIFDVKKIPISALIKQLAITSLGFIIPLAVMVMYFYFKGILPNFWFWTFKYLSQYGTQVPFSLAIENFFISLAQITGIFSGMGYTALWIVSFLGFLLVFFIDGTREKKYIIFSYLLFSFLTVIPGLYFRSHYYITMLPILSIFIGLFFDYLPSLFKDKLTKNVKVIISAGLFLLLFLQGIYANRNYLFFRNNDISCKLIYQDGPFAESIEIGNYIRNNSAKNDKILVFGSEPQIYFYADRISATGYIYTYNITEVQKYALQMQKEMVSEITANNPKYIIDINIKNSWSVVPKTEMYIFNWISDYKKYYKKIGHMEISTQNISTLIIDTAYFKPLGSPHYILLFERK